MPPVDPATLNRNLLLAALPPSERERVAPLLRFRALWRDDELVRPGEGRELRLHTVRGDDG